jgi:hypothetical protein
LYASNHFVGVKPEEALKPSDNIRPIPWGMVSGWGGSQKPVRIGATASMNERKMQLGFGQLTRERIAFGDQANSRWISNATITVVKKMVRQPTGFTQEPRTRTRRLRDRFLRTSFPLRRRSQVETV